MIENNVLTLDRDVGCKEVAYRSCNARRSQIASAVVIEPNNKNPRMDAAALQHKVVEHLEIVVVCGDDCAIHPGGERQMRGVVLTRHADLSWHSYVVPVASQ